MTDSIRTIASNFHVDVEVWRSFFRERVGARRTLVEGYLRFVEKLGARGLPPIFEGTHLARLLDLSDAEFARMTMFPDRNYRSFAIPKRRGGERTITAPSPLMLHCQRWIDHFILRKFAVHSAAHGYVEGRSNISNAACHLNSAQVLCLDISNFFGSIGTEKISDIFYHAGYPPSVCFLLAQLCSNAGHLPQGGASSPQLSNVIMFSFDADMHAYAQANDLIYSRYVDDITLSGARVSIRDVQFVETRLERLGLALNPDKIRFQRGKKRIVTGVAVGSGRLRLPRDVRRRYRNQAFLLLKDLGSASSDTRDPIAIERQLGRMAYWKSVEHDNINPADLFNELTKFRQRSVLKT